NVFPPCGGTKVHVAMVCDPSPLPPLSRRSRRERGIGKGTAVLAKVLSSTLLGVDAWIIEVEVDLANGLPTFTTVGLPDASIRESRDRVKAAMVNSGFPFPPKRITVNLAQRHYPNKGTPLTFPSRWGSYKRLDTFSPSACIGISWSANCLLMAASRPLPGPCRWL